MISFKSIGLKFPRIIKVKNLPVARISEFKELQYVSVWHMPTASVSPYLDSISDFYWRAFESEGFDSPHRRYYQNVSDGYRYLVLERYISQFERETDDNLNFDGTSVINETDLFSSFLILILGWISSLLLLTLESFYIYRNY